MKMNLMKVNKIGPGLHACMTLVLKSSLYANGSMESYIISVIAITSYYIITGITKTK